MNVFYYGRVFGGGDAGLLFAMSGFFVGVGFFESLFNIGTFLIFLMLSGSVYGLFYSGALYFRNRKSVNKSIVKNFRLRRGFVIPFVIFALGFFILGIFSVLFLILGLTILLFPFLLIFAKSLENASMIREVSGKQLREGDWLLNDEMVGKKTIKANWEGITFDELKLLRNKKKVRIKDGLPFVPAFLIAFIFYVFGREWLIELIL
jgi:hypothetical protein